MTLSRMKSKNNKPTLVVKIKNVPKWSMYLNTRPLVGAAVWEGYETFGIWRLVGRSVALRVGFESLQLCPTCGSLSASVYGQDVMSFFWYLPCN